MVAQAAGEVHQNAHQVNMDATVTTLTIVLMVLGVMMNTAQMVATIQQDAATVILEAVEEAHRNAHRVSINVRDLIRTIVLVDIGIVDHIVPTAAIRQLANVKAVLEAVEAQLNVLRDNTSAAVLIHTIVHMALGLQTNTVPTVVIHQQANAKAVQAVEVQQETNRVLALLAV